MRPLFAFLLLALCLAICSCGPQVRKYDEKQATPTIAKNRPTPTTTGRSESKSTTVKAILFKPKGGGQGAKVTVEVVDTQETIRRGLMFRKTMAENHGMLFMMPTRRYQSFWMKNTYLPLSIAFIGDDMKIINICKMKPLDTGPRYRSKKACRYALEVNQGWFDKNNIKAGDRAIFLSETK